ncbi:unnamed protein product [Rangifer tarandus platyrhynchus]|uniref:Uncharacterized protein n=2 Tax=Rangifer tarandus platyrhynchus TaxID=3082113 RepID=A0ABN8YEH3_RANTA|nr:unnamed protein product [Rangifer tarandus platyrhynchus]CAI9698500.1 unnamed protein product [Rangifer tarandus platyrhynchus]
MASPARSRRGSPGPGCSPSIWMIAGDPRPRFRQPKLGEDAEQKKTNPRRRRAGPAYWSAYPSLLAKWVTPPIPHAAAPQRWLPPPRQASSGFAHRDQLSSPQPEPFKQVPGKLVAAAFVGAHPVQKQRERGLDYEYDFIDDSHPLLFLNSGSAPRPTLTASAGAGRRAAVGPARRSSLPARARVGGKRLSLAPLGDSRSSGREEGAVCKNVDPDSSTVCVDLCVSARRRLSGRVCAWSRKTAQDAESPKR